MSLRSRFPISDSIEVQTHTEVASRGRLKEVIDSVKHRGSEVLVLATLVDATMSGWALSFCRDYGLRYFEAGNGYIKV